jgi:hypothetical protein
MKLSGFGGFYTARISDTNGRAMTPERSTVTSTNTENWFEMIAKVTTEKFDMHAKHRGWARLRIRALPQLAEAL